MGPSILLSLFQATGGLVVLLVGGEVLLRGAVALAQRLGLSKLLIGLTVVAAATSMPELVVSVASGLKGVPDVGVGNVVGSNIANILLILGTAALIFPIRTRPRHVLRDGAMGLVATALFIVFAFLGPLYWAHGAAMLALLVAYMGYSYRMEHGDAARSDPVPEAEVAAESEADRSCPFALLLVAAGVAGLIAGSRLLVDGSVDVARAAGVSEAVIGLSLVAVGTSLPELATALVAGFRRHPEVALGNVLGSNLFNILAILAALAFTTPFTVAPQMLRIDVWVMAAVSALLLPVMLSGWRIGRREGAVFLLAYGAYIASLYSRMGGFAG